MDLLTTTKLDELAKIVTHCGVDPNWDVLIFGDGSGAGWNLPIGFASILIDRHAKGRVAFYGGMNSGTINGAELMPYIQAVTWLTERRRRLAAQGKTQPALCRVSIVTDHKAIVQEGEALLSRAKHVREIGANRSAWASLMAFEWDGIVFQFHWCARATTALNCWADQMAKNCFRAMKEMPRPEVDGRPVSVYDCNADAPGATPLHAAPLKLPPGHRKLREDAGRDCPDGAVD